MGILQLPLDMRGMWATLDQYSPPSFKYLSSMVGQSYMSSSASVAGSGPKDRRLGQFMICKNRREMRLWRAKEARDSIPLILREVREMGRRHSSSGKETIFGNMFLIVNLEREVRVSRPHSDMGVFRFLQLAISSDVRLGAKPSSGKDFNPGHSDMVKLRRDLRFLI